MMNQWPSRITAASVLLALAGCAMPNVFKFSKDESPKAGPRNPVVRILGMWQAAEGMAQNKSTRGFSAQILFFSQSSDLPAQVDGDVRIYVFDDQGSTEDQAMPFHQEYYSAAAWKALMGKGPLGATYSVFVPYPRPGTHEAKCALRIRFTPKDGAPVYSEMVNVALPGAKKKEDKPSSAVAGESTEEAPAGQDESRDSTDHKVSKRMPPHAHGMATTIPTAQAIQEQVQSQQRVPATRLDAEERRRIMREAVSRLESGENTGRVALARYEEPESDLASGEEADAVQAVVVRQEVDGDTDDLDDDESLAPARSTRKPAMRHILDDE